MKKLMMAIALGLMVAACNSEQSTPDTLTPSKAITFDCLGDFTFHSFTRALSADGKDMTDLWILDYMDGSLHAQFHQSSTDADFGQPTLDLDYGSHTLYFVASRGAGAAVDTDAHTITFARVLDTFWQTCTITVSGSSANSRTVSLDRVVTKLRLQFTDPIPTGAATINMTPATWYYGLDYLDGSPTYATTSQMITINIPASNIGQTVSANVYGFSTTTEWTTNVSVNSKNSEGDIIGQAEIIAAPFRRNRVTEFSGPLYDKTRAMTFTLNSDWDDSYSGTW